MSTDNKELPEWVKDYVGEIFKTPENFMFTNSDLQIAEIKARKKAFRVARKVYARMEEENNKLRETIENLIKDWDKNNPEREQLKQGEGFEYWSPASSMLHSEFIAAARKLINKP